MPKAVVLGAGRIGAVIAADLAADFDVTIVDMRPEALRAAAPRSAQRPIKTVQLDLTDAKALRHVVAKATIVVGALASHIGYRTLHTVVEAGRPYCDISFMPEDPWQLDALAKQRGVTAVVDCGVAPGMGNLLASFGCSQLDTCERIAIYCGGLPDERRWPFQYKAGFSPADVIELYVRPCRLVEHGKVVVREALSEPELVDFAGVGTLEAFNTDGLRSMIRFLDVPFMKEKTMRYPGHIELMRVFRETGFFATDPVLLGNATVRPIDVTAALLFPKWRFEATDEDFTAMRVIVDGVQNGQPTRLMWELLDRYDRETGTTSMARVTAFPCTAVARLIASGEIAGPGILAPEVIGMRPGLADKVLAALHQRGVKFEQKRV